MKPRVGITVGDPAGIGPEIAVKAAADPRILEVCEPRLDGAHGAALAAFKQGEVSAEAGRAAYDAIVVVVGDAGRGSIDATATAPIIKETYSLASLPWNRHADLLPHLPFTPRV